MMLTLRSLSCMSPIAFSWRKVPRPVAKASDRMTMMKSTRASVTSISTRVKPSRCFTANLLICYPPDDLDELVKHDHVACPRVLQVFLHLNIHLAVPVAGRCGNV